jgi:hypothetical protein
LLPVLVLLSEAEGVALTKPKANTDVPEPTALALLALGVAGLALRRKIAEKIIVRGVEKKCR